MIPRLVTRLVPAPAGVLWWVSVPDTDAHTPPAPQRTFWQRRVRDPLVAQLTQGMTPEKIAETIAIGSCIALFPIPGVTTLLCFLVAILLRLNQPIIQLINQALWPVHISAIYLCVRLGETLFSAPHMRFSIKYMNSLFWDDRTMFLHRFGMTALYAIVAWALLAPLYIAAMYYIALPIMRKVAWIRADAAAKAAVEKPPEHPVP
jgi:uncharacterized protein (DUF2062 family)